MKALRQQHWDVEALGKARINETDFLYAFNEAQAAGVWRRRHVHADVGELAVMLDGSCVMLTETGNYLINGYRCLWIPPGVPHEFYMPTFCHNRTLHIHKSVLDGIQRFQSCQVLLLTPLLRELILAVDDWQLNLRQEEARYMGLALIACLKRSASLVSTWCMPRSRPLQAFCAAVLGTLDLRVSLSDWSRTLNVSPKSLTRMFVKETGLTIRKWIQLARLEHAYVLLAQGESVTTAALACGYSSVSSFIAAFRKQFGITPGAVR